MGCAGSKLDDLPAVGLCRERCACLDEAIRQRYALADAHVAYISSLSRIAHSLHEFFELTQSAPGQFSPVPNFPPDRKVSGAATSAAPAAPKGVVGGGGRGHSYSSSGSHLQFPSGSDDESGSESFSLHHSGHTSPGHIHGGHVEHTNPNQVEENMVSSYQGGYLHMNYMKNKATASAVYEQTPPVSSQGTIQFGESSSSYYPYPYRSANAYPHYGQPNYGGGGGGDGGYGYSSSTPQSYSAYGYGYSSQSPVAASEPSTNPPPPPPSPPRVSAFDFLNLFGTEAYDRYYTPSRNSRDVREEEGIPDLEDDRYQHEVVKGVDGKQKFVDAGSYSKSVAVDDSKYREARPVPAAENRGMEHDVPVMDKKVVNDDAEERRSEQRGGNAGRSKGFQGIYDVVREIEIQFKRASESGNQVAKMLEAGKLPYRRKHQGSLFTNCQTLSEIPQSISVLRTHLGHMYYSGMKFCFCLC